jgi:hypothetical protein
MKVIAEYPASSVNQGAPKLIIILDNDDVARLNNDPNHVIVDDKIWFGEDANNELPIVVEIKRQ